MSSVGQHSVNGKATKDEPTINEAHPSEIRIFPNEIHSIQLF
jgi:hypothetical protein